MGFTPDQMIGIYRRNLYFPEFAESTECHVFGKGFFPEKENRFSDDV